MGGQLFDSSHKKVSYFQHQFLQNHVRYKFVGSQTRVEDCKLSNVLKVSLLQTPTSLHQFVGKTAQSKEGRKREKRKKKKKNKKKTTPMLPPGVNYGVASFPSRSQYKHTYTRTSLFFGSGGFNTRDGKCLQFFMRWGHEYAHAIVTFIRLCKQAIKRAMGLTIPAFDVLKSHRNYTNIQEQSISD